MQAVSPVQALQVQRWIKGNEIWVCVLMEPTDTEKTARRMRTLALFGTTAAC
jgi:hypothetical protein